jgi:glycosyltransferase involved in cell wall biosynthesis
MVSIVIPVCNEGENIERALEEITDFVRFPYEICVVYDSDNDNTLQPAQRFIEKDSRVRLMKNAFGHGALNAIRTGMTQTSSQAVIVTMADLCDDPRTMNKMHEVFTSGCDIVCASRHMKGGARVGGPVLKSLMSRMAGLSLHWFTHIPTHDVTNSFKLYGRSVLEQIPIESKGGFELGMELTVKAYLRGFKIGEVPTVWRSRVEGESKFKMAQWLLGYLSWYLHCFRVFLPR